MSRHKKYREDKTYLAAWVDDDQAAEVQKNAEHMGITVSELLRKIISQQFPLRSGNKATRN